MKENHSLENYTYESLEESDIKKLSNKVLLEKIDNTYNFMKLNEIYLQDIKDDYGKQKIARLRVQFVRHQLDLLIRECLARGIKHGLYNNHKSS
jgi:hypothetical protein